MEFLGFGGSQRSTVYPGNKSDLVHDADWEIEKRHSGTAGFLLLSPWNDATTIRVDLPPKDSSLETLAIMQRYDS